MQAVVNRLPGRAIWVAAIGLVLITVAFAIHRIAVVTMDGVLADPLPAADPFDDRYNRHPVVSFLHILPGLVLLLLGPFQFSGRLRARWIGIHRWSGRIWLLCGVVAAASSLVAAVRLPAFGGWGTGLATYCFAVLFLGCAARAYRHVRRKEIGAHREWMIRAFSILLGVSMIRVFVLVLELATRLSTPAIFPIAFWLGFSSTLVVAEGWIRLTRPRRAAHVVPLTDPGG